MWPRLHLGLRRTAILVVTAGALVPARILAQEAGILASWARSGHPELPSASGFGAYFQVETSAAWIVGLGLTRVTDRTVKEGTVCQVYAPRVNCDREQVTTEPRLMTLGLFALKPVASGGKLRIAVGGGPTFSTLSVEAVGSSGRDADMFRNKALQLGGLLQVSLAAHPMASLPLRFSASLAGHWIHFRACADPEDRASGYDPFCGLERLDELRITASFLLPRMPGW